jgi:hypothetical protein
VIECPLAEGTAEGGDEDDDWQVDRTRRIGAADRQAKHSENEAEADAGHCGVACIESAHAGENRCERAEDDAPQDGTRERRLKQARPPLILRRRL